jgi:hypothetical protein
MAHVEIHVKGHIDRDWSDWMSALTVTHTPQGETILQGSIKDQSALYGLLERLCALGIQLNSLNSVDR